MSKFSEQIKSIRVATLMSQQELADALGVSISSLSRWESGKSKPTYKALKAIDAFCREKKIDFDVKTVLSDELGL